MSQVKPQDKQEIEIPRVEYNDEEKKYFNYLIRRLEISRDDRDQNHEQFDGMDYVTWYLTNRRADEAYIRPKKNKQDTRITTGLTHEKDNAMLSALLNFNFEPDIQAFDKDDLAVERIGEDMEDMVRKSRTVECYDDKRPRIYRELLAQGTNYVMETWVERFRIDKDFKDFDFTEQTTIKAREKTWTERMVKVFEGAESKLIDGRRVYLGDITEFFMNKQPFVFTRDIIPYEEAESIYGTWERWKNVPRKIEQFVPSKDDDESNFTGDWTLKKVNKDMVEIVLYMDKWNNEMQIILNGVMMLPTNFPLEAISPSGEYPLAKGDLEPNAFFAYSKGIPAKTKVDQAVFDRFLQMMILSQQKKNAPPMMNATKMVLSPDIHLPGMIINNMSDGQLNPIGDNTGISNSDVSMFNIIREMIDNKSVNAIFAGETPAGGRTATQILEEKKGQILKFGLAIAGIISLERQLAWLRIANITKHWTKVQDKRVNEAKKVIEDVFKKVEIDTTFADGTEGTKIINFNPLSTTPEELFKKNKEESEKRGKEVREVFINPEMLRNMKLNWFVEVVATEKNNDNLTQRLFEDSIVRATNIFGPQSMNFERLKDRWVQTKGEKRDDWFAEQPAQQPLAEALGQEAGGGLPPELPEEELLGEPTLNTLANL